MNTYVGEHELPAHGCVSLGAACKRARGYVVHERTSGEKEAHANTDSARHRQVDQHRVRLTTALYDNSPAEASRSL